MDVIARRGWSNKGSSTYAKKFAPRQSCVWTDKEDYDLIQQIRFGLSIEWIAQNHQRSLGSITSRLRLPERAAAGAARYGAGIPKPRTKIKKYNTKSWRRAEFRKHFKEQHHGTT